MPFSPCGVWRVELVRLGSTADGEKPETESAIAVRLTWYVFFCPRFLFVNIIGQGQFACKTSVYRN